MVYRHESDNGYSGDYETVELECGTCSQQYDLSVSPGRFVGRIVLRDRRRLAAEHALSTARAETTSSIHGIRREAHARVLAMLRPRKRRERVALAIEILGIADEREYDAVVGGRHVDTWLWDLVTDATLEDVLRALGAPTEELRSLRARLTVLEARGLPGGPFLDDVVIHPE